MTTFSEEFKKHADRIQLTDAERSRIRTAVTGAPPVPARIRSPFTFSYHHYSRSFALAFSLLLVVSVASGTLYAAEGTVPGDALYAVKRGITEPLTGALALTDEAETRWHARVASTRLAEAETLAADGKLTDEVGALLAADFGEHARAVADASEEADQAGEGDDQDAFRSLVAIKGAAILKASPSAGHASKIASAHFVLSVLANQDEDDGEKDDQPRAAMKAQPQAMMLMATTAPAEEDGDAVLQSEIREASLEDLADEAARAFEEARDAAMGRDARNAVNDLLPLLVKAQAEMAAGLDADARADFQAVLEGTRAPVMRDDAHDGGDDEARDDPLQNAEDGDEGGESGEEESTIRSWLKF